MNTFTASSGTVTVTENVVGSFKTLEVETIDNTVKLAGVHVDALREFFRAEEDERLGRWRWPENPDYVVYSEQGGLHVVLRESTGETVTRNGLYVHDLEGEAARAYRAAHPEPKPWHDAEVGEVFVVTWPGSGKREAVVVPAEGWPSAWECATEAHRIWPEVAS